MSDEAEAAATRKQLEAIAEQSRASPGPERIDAAAARVTEAIRWRGTEYEKTCAREMADVAGGARPTRLYHESREAWLDRLATWEATDIGREWTTARRRYEQDEADHQRRNAWPEVLELTTVPKALAELVWSGAEPTEALVATKAGNFRILVLAGKVGTGKSVAAASWLLAPHLPGAPVVPETGRRWQSLWVSASRLARWERYDDGEMSKLLRAPRLVIDDLYAEFNDAKGNFASILDEVINDRLSNKRPIVITTNATVEDFKARYGERIADRIREHGKFLSFSGDSMRRRT